MNYIIINGKKSDLIQGLLISRLPHITKPLIRTKVEEIEGRDGDIVTPLGYSAYNKELEIGLYGDYNIDDVISYFDVGGDIIFSNEPDKIYKFNCYEQIDFEKLVLFKTAKVKLHVQPFKYSAIEKAYTTTNLPNIVRNTGNIASKPIYEISGTGDVQIRVNNKQWIDINMEHSPITINVAEMQATWNNVLVNDKITGDYLQLMLEAGANTIETTGNVSEVKITNYSRWI